MKKLNKLALTATVLAIVNIASAEDIVGANTSKTNDGGFYIEVGKSNIPFGPHTVGRAGIGVQNSVFTASQKVDFEGLSTESSMDGIVYELHSHNPNIPDNHGDMGNFNFVKIGNGDVWMGEWSRDDSFDGRQVYYVGDKSGTSLPSDETATYTISGVNKFTGNNLMTGKLKADFGSRKLKATLERSGDRVKMKARIKSDASFKGTALFSHGRKHSFGKSKGQFFGNGASSVAGVANFRGKDKDTAFGGTKD